MKELLLIRHGETDASRDGLFCGSSNPSLNETGKMQVKSLVIRVGQVQPDAVFVSPLNRTVETAQLLGVESYQTADALRECHFGIFESLNRDQCAKLFPSEWSAWCNDGTIPLGGESVEMVADRLFPWLDSLQNNKYKTVMIISHGGIIRLALSYLLFGTAEYQWKFQVDTATIARIGFDGSFAYLKSLQER